jgi:hypothetical protein
MFCACPFNEITRVAFSRTIEHEYNFECRTVHGFLHSAVVRIGSEDKPWKEPTLDEDSPPACMECWEISKCFPLTFANLIEQYESGVATIAMAVDTSRLALQRRARTGQQSQTPRSSTSSVHEAHLRYVDVGRSYVFMNEAELRQAAKKGRLPSGCLDGIPRLMLPSEADPTELEITYLLKDPADPHRRGRIGHRLGVDMQAEFMPSQPCLWPGQAEMFMDDKMMEWSGSKSYNKDQPETHIGICSVERRQWKHLKTVDQFVSSIDSSTPKKNRVASNGIDDLEVDDDASLECSSSHGAARSGSAASLGQTSSSLRGAFGSTSAGAKKSLRSPMAASAGTRSTSAGSPREPRSADEAAAEDTEELDLGAEAGDEVPIVIAVQHSSVVSVAGSAKDVEEDAKLLRGDASGVGSLGVLRQLFLVHDTCRSYTCSQNTRS